MLRIINFRVNLKNKAPLQELVEKTYPQLRHHIKKLHVVRKAVDARKKPNISFVYTLFVEVDDEEAVLNRLKKKKDISQMNPPEPEPIVHGEEKLINRPVIMGFGPSGMLAALFLAREGYKPLVLERGMDADTRTKDVLNFWETGKLNLRSNVQFGEGGAGTFSDGKLTTRVTHPRLHEIAKYFVEFGAPKEIIYKHKPHVGTDILRDMVKNLRKKVIDLGGEVRFNSQVTDIKIENDQVVAVEVNGEEIIPTNHVLAGIGHSARDTYQMLFDRQVAMRSKPLAIGVRIEHSQAMIDESQYGMPAKELGLGAAEYSLVYHDKETGRTAYTFCMCPGGHVVASASEEGGVVTNGMSCYARNSGVANSAMVVTVGPADFGEHPLAGIEFQRKWERKAFAIGGKNYSAPLQLVGDFMQEQATKTIPDNVVHTYEPNVVPADLRDCLPKEVTDVMRRALPYFGRRIKGFDNSMTCMTGVETRTSAPVRIDRGKDYVSINLRGFYPMGEGAGYAGGIMSAALDGAETAVAFMKKYAPIDDK